MKAYKMFNNDWTCQGFQFEVGKTYVHKGEVVLCRSGFHACQKLEDCFEFYPAVPWSKIAKVELSGKIARPGADCSKVCAEKITIVKEIKFDDLTKILKGKKEDGVNWSSGVNESSGVNGSNGVNGSTGVNACSGLSLSLFCCGLKNEFKLFNQQVSESRHAEVKRQLDSYLAGWEPTFNNLKTLNLKANGVWQETPIPFAKELQVKEAWAGMPKAAIDYLRSLPEFDADIFAAVTGIL